MPTWRPEYNPAHLYFVTITAVDRAMLFRRDLVRRLLVDVLDTMRLLHRLDLYAFVIMPNHMHFIVPGSFAGPWSSAPASICRVARTAD